MLTLMNLAHQGLGLRQHVILFEEREYSFVGWLGFWAQVGAVARQKRATLDRHITEAAVPQGR
jgi:hypothetical protein